MSGSTPTSDGIDSATEQSGGIAWKRAFASTVMALVVGGLGAWGTSQMGLALPAFVVLAAASGYHLYRKPIATKAVGVGLYWVAAVGVLVPLLFYVPTILAPGDGAAGAGTFVGSVLGFFIWGVVFGVGALIAFVLGYFVNKRANRKLDAST